jgi:midasin
MLSDLCSYAQDVVDISSATAFNEGIFQTYLIIGRTLASYSLRNNILHDAGSALNTGLLAFNAAWKLSTGGSMELLWSVFKPRTARNAHHLKLLIRIERLAKDFDNLVWGARASLDVLVRLRESIISTYLFLDIDSRDADTLLQVFNLFQHFTENN